MFFMIWVEWIFFVGHGRHGINHVNYISMVAMATVPDGGILFCSGRGEYGGGWSLGVGLR